MRIAAWIAVAWLMPLAAAAGRDIYVNNASGDDRFSGDQQRSVSDVLGPVRTIAKALRLAVAGDRIVLAQNDEPYRESFTILGRRLSGTASQPLVIEGNGAVLDGSAPVPPDQWVFYRDNLFRFRPPRMGSFQQLFLQRRPAERRTSGKVGGGLPKLQPRQWCLDEGYICFAVDPTKLPADYDLSYASLPTGITLYNLEHVTIKELTVQGFQTDGIQAVNNARKIFLGAVTCRSNGRSGLTVGGSCQVEIDSCSLGNNGVAQLLTLPYSETHVNHSELLGNTAPAWVDQGGTVWVGPRRVRGGLNEIQRDAE
ncbi:MAG: right-handed parallel beta-helix repeat-containing protein [Thermoguttaceae bacterium]|jgi:hypothetical protein